MSFKTIPLGDYILLQRGFDLPSTDRLEGVFPVVASTGIVAFHKEYKVKGPGVVIGRSGSIGGGQYITDHFWPLNTTLWVKDFKGHPKRFVYYLLKSLDFSRFNSGGAVPSLNRNLISHLKVPDLGYDTELRIENVLGTLDDKIANNNRINQTLEEIAQALFQSWFVDFEPVKAKIQAKTECTDTRLAAMCVISGKTEEELQQLSRERYNELATIADLFPDELLESELGMIPKGWKVSSLYDTAEYVNGAAFKTTDFSDNKVGLPIIKIVELKAGLTEQTKHTLNEMPAKYKIKDDDMLYSWSGSPETSLEVFKWFGGDGWLNQHIFKVNTKNTEQKVFIYFLLKHLKPTLIAIAKNKQTTGLGHVTVADMKRIKVVVPSRALNILIKSKIVPLYDLSSNCMKQNAVLAQKRDSLIPKLLLGEINI